MSSPILLAPRASACPGLLRIAPALDGGICRVKLPCGQLNAAQAKIVAEVSMRCATGVIDITNRANLQLRGVRDDFSAKLIDALIAAGLGPLTPTGDDVRNLLVSPTFGIDSEQILDTTTLAAHILEHLQTQPRFTQLSPKFSLSLDGGERSAMLEHPHDIWLAALSPEHLVFGFAGSPARGKALGIIAVSDTLAFIDTTINVFLDFAAPTQTRMRHLLQSIDVTEFLAHVRKHCEFSGIAAEWQRKPTPEFSPVGAYAQRQSGWYWIGAAPTLGRLHAEQLREIARITEVYGDGTLRFTPWQSVLLPNIRANATENVLSELRQLDLHTQADDPLLHVIACAGAAGCAKAHADTKADALQLAAILRERSLQFAVHLSGCERSCAAAHVAPFTLLAVVPGRYDVYRRDECSATFGELIARNCDIEQCVSEMAFTQNKNTGNSQ